MIPTMQRDGVGLLLWGANGRGKTGIAACLLMEARRRGYTGLFVPVAALKDMAFNNIMYNASTRVIQRARSVDVLVLDDLGKGVQDRTGAGARLLDELIRERALAMRVTHITTNMSPVLTGDKPSQLEEEIKISTLHAMKDRIVNLLVGGVDLRDGNRMDVLSTLRGER